MAPPLLLVQRHCRLALSLAGRCWSSTGPAPVSVPLFTRLRLFLTTRYYDAEGLFDLVDRWRNRKLRTKNVFFAYAQKHYGDNIATAYFITTMEGRFRFAGHTEWFQPNQRGKYNREFMKHKDTPIEEADLSHSLITYSGLDNLALQSGLRTLSLRGCKELDDWALSKLHVFQDSLEELDISHCPRLTARGLPPLVSLRALRRLDISSLPGLHCPGIVILELEDMLPHCTIIADGYDHSLRPEPEQREEEEEEVEQRESQGWATGRR